MQSKLENINKIMHDINEAINLGLSIREDWVAFPETDPKQITSVVKLLTIKNYHVYDPFWLEPRAHNIILAAYQAKRLSPALTANALELLQAIRNHGINNIEVHPILVERDGEYCFGDAANHFLFLTDKSQSEKDDLSNLKITSRHVFSFKEKLLKINKCERYFYIIRNVSCAVMPFEDGLLKEFVKFGGVSCFHYDKHNNTTSLSSLFGSAFDEWLKVLYKSPAKLLPCLGKVTQKDMLGYVYSRARPLTLSFPGLYEMINVHGHKVPATLATWHDRVHAHLISSIPLEIFELNLFIIKNIFESVRNGFENIMKLAWPLIDLPCVAYFDQESMLSNFDKYLIFLRESLSLESKDFETSLIMKIITRYYFENKNNPKIENMYSSTSAKTIIGSYENILYT